MSYQHRGAPRGAQSHGPRNVQVTTNCFEITRVPTKNYYQYDVALTPEVKIPRKRQEIIHKLQIAVAPDVFSPRALYDGNALMFVSHEILRSTGGTGRFLVSLRTDNSTVAGQTGVYEVKVTRTIGEPIKPSDLKALTVTARSTGLTPKMATATNLLQLLIRQSPNQRHPHNKNAFFSSDGCKELGEGLQLWRGFFQSVRPTLDKLLINVDTTVAAVYQAGGLIDLIMAHLRINNIRDLEMSENDPRIRSLESFINNLRIHTSSSSQKTRTIRGIVTRAGEYPFEKDGRPTTVADHFREVYNIRIRHPQIIGVRLSGKKGHNGTQTVVPLEVCKVIPGQLYKKRLPNRLTADVVKFSAQPPHKRMDAILKNAESPVKTYTSSEFITESGMAISSTPETIKGKLLPPPQLRFGGNTTHNPSRGSWNVMGKKLYQAVQLKCWIVVNLCSTRLGREVERLVQTLVGCCASLGMEATGPAAIIEGNPQGNISQILTNAVLGTAQEKKFNPNSLQLVLVVLPEKADAIRIRVKYWGDVDKGVRTQCVREGKVRTSNSNSQYCNNVALKINARLGGINSAPNSAMLNLLAKDGPFMIMGADVSHPGPGVLKPSVASVVWSLDSHAARYGGFTDIQHPRAEFIIDIGTYIRNVIISFVNVNKIPPVNIIFYRDGLSEGEFAQASKQEISTLQEALQLLWKQNPEKLKDMKGNPAPLPKLTFIVVGKRHHITFFANGDRDVDDGKGNCTPGFVTDKGQLENPLVPDFYLQSHAAIQGTSRSGHYILLHDEIFNHDLAKIQNLSFDLTHAYAKATRSVSIPAPVYYADLACARGAFHLNPSSSLHLDDTSSVASGGTTFKLDPWKQAFESAKLGGMFFL